jgi:hypothetical protein
MPEPDDDEQGQIIVTSEVQPDGSYAVTIAFTPDNAVTLTDDQALHYAMTILELSHRSEYDAAIIKQLGKMNVNEAGAAEFISDYVRPHRAVLKTGTHLELIPGVSQRTKKGFLVIMLNGKEAGQWDVDDARSHAIGVIDTICIARLDAVYHYALAEHLKLDDAKARHFVWDIGNNRS